MDTRQPLKRGFEAAWPICMGYLPLGLAMGVLAAQAGMSPFQTALMSILVFAGSGQFIAVGMLTEPVWSIVMTTFMVNLRHLLMSSTLAEYFKGRSRPFIAAASYGITDETFAVNLTRFLQGGWDPESALATNEISHSCWVISTVLGCYAGALIPAGAFGIDYALTAMFLCLIVFQVREKLHAIIALVAGGISVLCVLYIPGRANVIVATVVAATIGAIIKSHREREQ